VDVEKPYQRKKYREKKGLSPNIDEEEKRHEKKGFAPRAKVHAAANPRWE